MTDGVVPIRPDIVLDHDLEKEVIDWLTENVRKFGTERGKVRAVGLYLAGPDSFARVVSWSPGEDGPSRAETCGAAAALFLERAVKP